MSAGDRDTDMFHPLSEAKRQGAEAASRKKPEFIERLPKNHAARYVYRSAAGKVKFVV